MGVVDGKRIAKNTMLLYVRMIVVTIIGLYTSRVVLDVLGESDFGLYNAVGGIIVAFSFLNGVMTSACNRYFAIELGQNDYDALARVFKINVTIFIAIAIIILLLSESIGLWYLNNKLVFDEDRRIAVNWVFQFSVISFIVTMLSTPYRAMIIAKEKMKVFAYNSVVEAILKLGAVFALTISSIDNLIFYALLMLLINVGVCGFYYVYCRVFYKECRYNLYWNKSLFNEVIGYTGWNVIGNVAVIGKSQGLNLLLNSFFGPIVNAARAIAYQVYYTINQLVVNFMMATVPQITKAYSSGEHEAMLNLIFQSSRISYFLSLVMLLPLYLQLPFVLNIWLVDVPEHTIIFTRLVFINAIIDSLSQPLASAMQATGRIKWYQIMVGGSLLFILPISYILLEYCQCPSETVFYVSIVFSIIAQVIRMMFVKNNLGMSIKKYFLKVLRPIIIITIISPIIPLLLQYQIDNVLGEFFTVCISSVAIVVILVWIIGLERSEKDLVRVALKHKFGGKSYDKV